MQALRSAKLTSNMLTMLLAVLLLAQTIGVMHRIAHSKHAESAYAQLALESTSQMHSLWGDHNNASDCRVFDQNCPDLLVFANWQLTLTQSLPTFIVALLQARFSLFERFYSAQGPPVALH